MEGSSSGDELAAVKLRKPYTITKQRERWTDEEHNLFIEALKLYGRAWQRIEEHIGTKTAVQIRSHAQKFFTKLEKEALEKGIPPGQTHDIDIPPPRPKRKPANPYPRKPSTTGTLHLTEELNGKPSKSIPTFSTNEEMDAMSDAPGKKFTATQMVSSKEISADARCSEVVNVFQDAQSSSFSSVNKSSSNCSKYMEFLPTKEKIGEKNETDKSPTPREVVEESNRNGESSIGEETARVEGNCTMPQINLDPGEEGKALKFQDLTSKDTVRGEHTHPMHIVCRNDETNMQTEESGCPYSTSITSQVEEHANDYRFMKPAFSAIPIHNVLPLGYINHPLPALIPFTYFHSDQDACGSFLTVSSAFASLIVSTLQQHPALHAAATLAASFWPPAGTGTHSTPEIRAGEIPERHVKTPSLEAITSATVGAAAAWWSAQGQLPWFPSCAGFVVVPPNANGVLSACTTRGPVCGDTVQNPPREIQQGGDENNSEALNAEHHGSSKLLPLLSSYSDDGVGGCSDNSGDPKGTRCNNLKSSEASGFPDSDKGWRKKKRDGSSCGSNKTSSSEIETDTMEKKQEKASPEVKEGNFCNLFCETNHRRPRSSGSMYESWKEVSEEGRLAFQALFKREVLPQSFAPLLDGAAPTTTKGEASESPTDDSKKDHLHCGRKEETCTSSNDRPPCTAHAKFKIHQTGFKPYKRCSVEAENSAAPVEETGNKRMRLQGEATS